MSTSKNSTVPDNMLTMEKFNMLLGYHLRRASKAVQADLADVLAPYKLRMITFSALVVIDENSGLRQSQFADVLEIERPNSVMIIDELEKRELIRRDPAESDRRAYALRLTDAGEKLLKEVKWEVEKHEFAMFGKFTAEQKAQLRDMLITIRGQRRSKNDRNR